MKLNVIGLAGRKWVSLLIAIVASVGMYACADALRIEPPAGGDGNQTTSTATAGGSTSGTGGAGGGSSVIPCVSNSDCPEPTNVCDTVKGYCVGCLEQSDCAHKPGTVCDAGECDCPGADSFCEPDLCVDLQTSSEHCGSCGHACFGACADGACADPWEPTATEGSPASRMRHLAVWTGTEMIVWGGTTSSSSSGATNTGGIYNPATSTWRDTSIVNAPKGRTRASVVWTGKVMIVWGGMDASGNPLNDGGILDPATNTWQVVAPDSLVARYDHTAIWTGSDMIIWGGTDASGNELASGGRFNPEQTTWLATAVVSAPAGRTRHTAVWDSTNKAMLIWGGMGDGSNVSNTVIPGDDLPGGRLYDVGSNSWGVVENVGQPSGRQHHTAIYDGTRMVLFGGEDASGNEFNDGYSLASNSWSPFSGSGPGERSLHTAVWLADAGLMIVWGGSDNGTYLDSGAEFAPSTNTWQKTTPTALEGRRHHSAISTGKSMIVWGGQSQNGARLKTGGIYTP